MNLRIGLTTIFLWGLIFYAIYMVKKDSRESFTSSYVDCRQQGYSKEFCVKTPASVIGTDGCQCEDGSLGFIMPGFRGQCVC